MKDEARYCPKCSSAHVAFGELIGATATCQSCGWIGTKEELYNVSFSHVFNGHEGIVNELFNDLRRLLGDPTFMQAFVKFLSRWGFIDAHAGKDVLIAHIAKYGAAAAQAMIQSVIEERAKLEKEKTSGPGKPTS